MSHYGTPAFKEAWAREGFFYALSKSSNSPAGVTPLDMYRMNAALLREATAELRKEILRISASVERIEHTLNAASSTGRAEQLHYQQNVEALAGWIASAMETFARFTFYLSVPSHRRAFNFIKEQSEDLPHPTMSPNDSIQP